MFIGTQENYREAFKTILGLSPYLRIFTLTLFNILAGPYLERETYSVVPQRIQEPVSALLWKHTKTEIFDVATKLSFSAPNQSFLDRLYAFSIARMLESLWWH